MNLLIPGGAGYIGAMLVPKLLADGHRVTVIDTMWFGHGYLPKDNGNLTSIKGDVRDHLFCGHDAVIWLASISNNAMYGINYDLTHAVNTYVNRGNAPKFIYASSVAVADPTSDYAKDKLFCESVLAGTDAIIVRSASVCGYSIHQRLDLTVNMMTHHACRNGIVRVNGGDQMRSHVHIDDICDFYRYLLSADLKGTFTVVAENQAVKDTARLVADTVGATVITGPATDARSYTVTPAMGDFKPKKTITDAVRDLEIRFDSGYWPDSQTNEQYQNINRGI